MALALSAASLLAAPLGPEPASALSAKEALASAYATTITTTLLSSAPTLPIWVTPSDGDASLQGLVIPLVVALAKYALSTSGLMVKSLLHQVTGTLSWARAVSRSIL